MLIQLSTGAVDAMIGSTGLAGALEAGGMELRIYAGTLPADADAAIGGATLLVTIKNGASALTWDNPAGGIISKPAGETWSGTAVATNTATFGRFVVTADTGALSTTAVRIQGDVATIGAFINLDNPAMVSGAVQTVNSAQLIQPRQ